MINAKVISLLSRLFSFACTHNVTFGILYFESTLLACLVSNKFLKMAFQSAPPAGGIVRCQNMTLGGAQCLNTNTNQHLPPPANFVRARFVRPCEIGRSEIHPAGLMNCDGHRSISVCGEVPDARIGSRTSHSLYPTSELTLTAGYRGRGHG